MEYKSITGATADVDTASRRVKIVISEMGSKDQDNDIIAERAYDKTISERGPKGKNLIYHLRDHNASIATGLIAKFSELYVEGNQLIGISVLPDTVIGNDMLKHYAAGNINQHSVGFSTIASEQGKSGGPRILKELKLYEGSACLFGANENTPTLSVGKSAISKKFDIEVEIGLIYKEIKSGSYNNDGYELLNLRFMQLVDQVKYLVKPTQAAKAPEPDSVKFLTDKFSKLVALFPKQAPQAAGDTAAQALAGRRLAGRFKS
jgi:HK97 family phage prohead protease